MGELAKTSRELVRTAVAVLLALTPLAIIPVGIFAFLHPTLTVIVVSVEVSLLLLVAWALVYLRPSTGPGSPAALPHRLLDAGEALVLGGALLLLVGSGSAYRPTLFFVLMGAFYLLMFLRLQGKYDRVWPYVTKLIVGQALFAESFALGYPSVFSVDSSRDFQIASHILAHSGGLPASFTTTVWYDFTPMAPLSYAMNKLVTGLPLMNSELLTGFLVTALVTLAVGGIAWSVSKSAQTALLAMWVSSLVPYVWQYATWPIPQMPALAMSLLLIGILIGRGGNSGVAAGAVFALVVVLTHGGMALELILILSVIAVATRSRANYRLLALAAAFYATYVVYASVESAPTGLVTISVFVKTLLTLGEAYLGPSSPLGIASLAVSTAQQVSLTYWWIFLGAFGWLGLLAAYRLQSLRARLYLLLFGTAFLLLVFGAAVGIAGSAQAQAFRYVSTVGYPLLCIPVAMLLASVISRSSRTRAFALLAVSLLIFSMVADVSVSSDLWQNLGQTGYAGGRLSYVTTVPELYSQAMLNGYDGCYPVVANYYPQFTNLTAAGEACSAVGKYHLSSESAFSTVGVASPFSKVSAPYVVLYSGGKAVYTSYVSAMANPQSNITIEGSDVIYSGGSSYIAFVG
ncbi:MAG TPA: hypothetical protein VJR06_05685 [Nitrososphaerales archaeon]|nr:hypothetical protein [Nitrososphaerales archaeon]